MAARWPGIASLVLLLASLCCVSFAHGRTAGLSSLPGAKAREVQRGGCELDGDFEGITSPRRGDVKISSPSIGKILIKIGVTDTDQQSQNHPASIIQGQKWKRTLRMIAEWILHACIVVLAVYAVVYTVSCICTCCMGLDLLAEIWRILGGWQGFSYFVRVEETVAETDPEPLPLLRAAVEP